MSRKNLIAGLVLAGLAGQASAVTITTGPVLVNDPADGVNNEVWCIAQNLDKNKARQVTGTVIFANTGGVVQTGTKTLNPGFGDWIAGATGGSGLVYCTFDVPNKTTVRGYLAIQQSPVGQSQLTTTLLTLEAK